MSALTSRSSSKVQLVARLPCDKVQWRFTGCHSISIVIMGRLSSTSNINRVAAGVFDNDAQASPS